MRERDGVVEVRLVLDEEHELGEAGADEDVAPSLREGDPGAGRTSLGKLESQPEVVEHVTKAHGRRAHIALRS